MDPQPLDDVVLAPRFWVPLGVVLLGLLVQGFSLVPLAQRLGLTSADAA